MKDFSDPACPFLVCSTPEFQQFPPLDELVEETPLTAAEQLAAYAQAALDCHASGAKALLLTGFSNAQQLRYAILGAKQAQLALYVLVETDPQGFLPDGTSFAALLAAVQHLGICGMGFRLTHGTQQDTLALLESCYPYASVPLLLPLQSSQNQQELQHLLQYKKSGAEYFLLPDTVSAIPPELLAYSSILAQTRCSASKDTETFFMSCGTQAFYLTKDTLRFSAPLTCHYDMSAEILAAEEQGCDVLYLMLETLEDAEYFALNAHMFRMPLCLSSHNELVLEAALIAFPGRVFADLRTEVPEEQILQLAQAYGAAVL